MARTSKLNTHFAGNPAFAEGQERARSYMRIGVELRRMREQKGLTQEDVALSTGLDQGDISRLETGKWGNRISFDVLGRLLPVFGLHISHEVRPLPGLGPTLQGQLASAQAITNLLQARCAPRKLAPRRT